MANPAHFTGPCKVTLANVVSRQDTSCCKGLLKGHAIIIVQQNNTNTYGYYHIGAIRTISNAFQNTIGNTQGEIITLIAEKGAKINWEINDSIEWFDVPSADINAMIDNISAESAKLKADNATIPYQKGGNQRWAIWGGNGGHSCVTWAMEKLAVANLQVRSSALDSSKSPTARYLTPGINIAAVVCVITAGLFFKRNS